MRILTREFRLDQMDFACLGFGLFMRRRWWWIAAALIGGRMLQLMPSPMSLGLGFALMGGAILYPGLVWLWVCAMAARPNYVGFYAWRMMEIDESGIFVQVRGEDPISIPWSHVVEVRRAHGGWMIRTSGLGLHYLPVRALRDADDVARFQSYLVLANATDPGRDEAGEPLSHR